MSKQISIAEIVYQTEQVTKSISAVTAVCMKENTSMIQCMGMIRRTQKDLLNARLELLCKEIEWMNLHFGQDLLIWINEKFFKSEFINDMQAIYLNMLKRNHMHFVLLNERRLCLWELSESDMESKFRAFTVATGIKLDTEDAVNILFRRRLTNLYWDTNWFYFQVRLLGCTCGCCSGYWNCSSVWSVTCTCQCALCRKSYGRIGKEVYSLEKEWIVMNCAW